MTPLALILVLAALIAIVAVAIWKVGSTSTKKPKVIKKSTPVSFEWMKFWKWGMWKWDIWPWKWSCWKSGGVKKAAASSSTSFSFGWVKWLLAAIAGFFLWIYRGELIQAVGELPKEVYIVGFVLLALFAICCIFWILGKFGIRPEQVVILVAIAAIFWFFILPLGRKVNQSMKEDAGNAETNTFELVDYEYRAIRLDGEGGAPVFPRITYNVPAVYYKIGNQKVEEIKPHEVDLNPYLKRAGNPHVIYIRSQMGKGRFTLLPANS